jgi:cytochrome P450 family 103
MSQLQAVARSMSEPIVVSREELDRNPHGVFRWVRPLSPVLMRDDGVYIALRAADVQTLPRDPRTRQVETELLEACGITCGGLFDFYQNSLLFSNGPTHHKRRAALSRAFAFRLAAEWRPRIRASADGLIRAAWLRGELNLLDDYAAALSGRVISSILGVPKTDLGYFAGLVARLSVGLSCTVEAAQLEDIELAGRDLARYVDKLLTVRAHGAGSALLATYVAGIQEQGQLRPAEAVMQIITLILAGAETTRVGLTMLVATLLGQRDQWDAVCQDAALVPGAVAEALRYEPPVGSLPRFTLQVLEMGGHVVPAGRVLLLSTLAALRDPAVHALPDRFDVRRGDHQSGHLAFGAGAHRCLGEFLARAELEEGLAALAARLPGLEIMGDRPVIHGHAGIRRVTGMRVGWQRQPGFPRRLARATVALNFTATQGLRESSSMPAATVPTCPGSHATEV